MPNLNQLVALAAGQPQTRTQAGQPQVTGNARKRAYEAGKQAAQQSGMTEVEMILFIEGFRAGLLNKVIEG